MTPEPTTSRNLLRLALDDAGRKPQQRRAARLLRLRSTALHAEAGGKQTAADFLWTEAHRALAWLMQHPRRWQRFAAALCAWLQVPGVEDVERLLRDFIGAAFVDTHLSLYEAWQGKSDERAWTHLRYARRLLPLSAFTLDEEQRRIGPRSVLEIRRRQQLGQYATAVTLAADLLWRFHESSEYLAVWCEAHVAATGAQLRNKDQPRHRAHDARVLAAGLYELKRVRLDRPHHLSLLAAIAGLHRQRAETLEASGLLAEALVDAEASVAYAPGVTGSVALRQRLETALQRLRVEAVLPESERPVLKAREERLRAQQAAKGFRLVEAFRRSDEARSVAEDLPVAQGRATWERIGLAPLEPIDHRPLALEDALQTILAAPPAEPAAVPPEWQRVSQDNPHLRALDADRVCSYLAHRLFGHEFSPAGADVPNHELPPATVLVSAPTKSSEPFWLWLFSSRSLRLKAQMAAAVVLAVSVVVVGTGELRARSSRARAYAALRQARGEARFDTMLDAAESFMSQRLIGRDERVAEVEALYSEALVRWFNEMGPTPDVAERRLARYRQLLWRRE